MGGVSSGSQSRAAAGCCQFSNGVQVPGLDANDVRNLAGGTGSRQVGNSHSNWHTAVALSAVGFLASCGDGGNNLICFQTAQGDGCSAVGDAVHSGLRGHNVLKLYLGVINCGQQPDALGAGTDTRRDQGGVQAVGV